LFGFCSIFCASSHYQVISLAKAGEAGLARLNTVNPKEKSAMYKFFSSDERIMSYISYPDQLTNPRNFGLDGVEISIVPK